MKKTIWLLLPALLLAGAGSTALAANRVVLCEEFGRTT